MKVVIFGASGATGQILVDLAAQAGYDVVAFVRNPVSVSFPPSVSVVKGDVRSAADVNQALIGADAVVSALGSRNLSKDDLLEVGISNIIEGMRVNQVKRIVILGAAGALHDAQKYQGPGRKFFFWIIKNTFLKHPMRDSGNQERIVEASELDYTVVHPPRLLNEPAVVTYRVVVDGLSPGGHQIPRADVAEFMIRQLSDLTYLRRGPYIAT